MYWFSTGTPTFLIDKLKESGFDAKQFSADDALKQIGDTGYALAYEADNRTILKVGVNFDSKERTIDDWKVIIGE